MTEGIDGTFINWKSSIGKPDPLETCDSKFAALLAHESRRSTGCHRGNGGDRWRINRRRFG